LLITDFTSDAPGQLIQNLEGRLTFLPNPLPPKIDWPNTLLKQASDVSNVLGRLDGIASGLPDQQILIRSFVRREAQLSSFIENTYARYEEVAELQREKRPTNKRSEVWETWNAEQAINAGVEAVFEHGQPITLSLIRQIHGLLLDGVRGGHAKGRFRDVQVYIGKAHESPEQARFVPPPCTALLEAMEQFQHYLSGENDLPALLQIGLLHYQFETIHPFEDGNGRLGRILVLLGLCQHRLLTVPLLNASLYFERHRQDYYDALLGVSSHGKWVNWLSFFVEGIRVAAEEAIEKLRELNGLKRAYYDQIHAIRGTGMLLKLVDNLFVSPRINIADAVGILGVSTEAARQNVKKLVGIGVLRQIDGVYPALFVADTILKAVNAEPTRR
jgi:Fic family protein